MEAAETETQNIEIKIQRKRTLLTAVFLFIHALAGVVELGEDAAQFVQEVAKAMQEQVFFRLDDDVTEAQQRLGQLPLLFMLQSEQGAIFGGIRQLIGSDSRLANDGAVETGKMRKLGYASRRFFPKIALEFFRN